MSDFTLFKMHIQDILNCAEILHFVHHYHKSDAGHYLFLYVNSIDAAEHVHNILSYISEVESVYYGMDEDGDSWVQLNLYKELF